MRTVCLWTAFFMCVSASLQAMELGAYSDESEGELPSVAEEFAQLGVPVPGPRMVAASPTPSSSVASSDDEYASKGPDDLDDDAPRLTRDEYLNHLAYLLEFLANEPIGPQDHPCISTHNPCPVPCNYEEALSRAADLCDLKGGAAHELEIDKDRIRRGLLSQLMFLGSRDMATNTPCYMCEEDRDITIQGHSIKGLVFPVGAFHGTAGQSLAYVAQRFALPDHHASFGCITLSEIMQRWFVNYYDQRIGYEKPEGPAPVAQGVQPSQLLLGCTAAGAGISIYLLYRVITTWRTLRRLTTTDERILAQQTVDALHMQIKQLRGALIEYTVALMCVMGLTAGGGWIWWQQRVAYQQQQEAVLAAHEAYDAACERHKRGEQIKSEYSFVGRSEYDAPDDENDKYEEWVTCFIESLAFRAPLPTRDGSPRWAALCVGAYEARLKGLRS